jgi:SAM-dependent methyltransferase
VARISYDDQTAAAYKAVREIPRDGLSDWREAVRRHLRPAPGMTVVDIGAGTGVFATAFSDWFGLSVLAVEPSAAMRAQIPGRPGRPALPGHPGRPRHQGIQVLDGQASALPLPDQSADGAWMSLMIHHIPDLGAAAREIRRVLRPGAPVLIRQGYPGRGDPARTFPWEFFPETARSVSTFPTVEQVCQAFGTAGFRREAIEPVPERWISLAGFLEQADSFRRSDTNLRSLTEEEYLRGKEQLRRAVEQAGPAARNEARTSWLELLVLR